MVHEVDFSGRGVLHTLADGNQAEPEEKIVAMVNPFSKSSEQRTPPLEQEIKACIAHPPRRMSDAG